MMKATFLLIVLLALGAVHSEEPQYYGYGYGGGCIDTLSGCGGYVSMGYCGQAYYASACCASCGGYKKKK